jgi:hypothetical protein
MSFTQGIALGQLGCFVETTANVLNNAPTGREWFAVQVVTDTKFHTLTNASAIASANSSSDSLANTTAGSALVIPAGTILYGTFTAFQLHSGIVIAYFGS